MRTSAVICAILFVAGVLTALAQVWFGPWSQDVFFKLMLTDGALLLMILVPSFLVKEYRESKELEKATHPDQDGLR